MTTEPLRGVRLSACAELARLSLFTSKMAASVPGTVVHLVLLLWGVTAFRSVAVSSFAIDLDET
ncbi:hypothetical protein chiPu_0026261, partial [Chiloscyllium punctatum]|nr:hypothetical protein [Chiloscyllium punctatum]